VAEDGGSVPPSREPAGGSRPGTGRGRRPGALDGQRPPPAAAEHGDADQRVEHQHPQLRKLNTWTWAAVGSGTRPSSIISHCTGVAVSSSVSQTAMPLDASHSPCSSATSTYQPSTAPVSRSRPLLAAAANSAPPTIAVHDPYPTGVSTPRRISVWTRLSSDSPCMVNIALNA